MEIDIWRLILLLLVLLAQGTFVLTDRVEVGAAEPAASNELPPLTLSFDQSPAFGIDYPDTWAAQVGEGILIIGEEETIFRGIPGPSVVVNRLGLSFIATLEENPNLQSAMETYLRRGPLLGGDFEMLGEISAAVIGGREALAATVEGREVEVDDAPVMRVYLVATRADNGYFYFFTAAAPAEHWDEEWPLMEAIMSTADIRE